MTVEGTLTGAFLEAVRDRFENALIAALPNPSSSSSSCSCPVAALETGLFRATVTFPLTEGREGGVFVLVEAVTTVELDLRVPLVLAALSLCSNRWRCSGMDDIGC
jgi:hypothetical protein